MPAQQGAGASTGPSGAKDSPLSAQPLDGASSGTSGPSALSPKQFSAVVAFLSDLK